MRAPAPAALSLAALALAVCPSAPARADDGLRCGARLVSVGETAAAVAAKCGPPTSASEARVARRSRYRRFTTVLATWVYDRGPTEFVRTLSFVDGVLSDVEVGDYGR